MPGVSHTEVPIRRSHVGDGHVLVLLCANLELLLLVLLLESTNCVPFSESSALLLRGKAASENGKIKRVGDTVGSCQG